MSMKKIFLLIIAHSINVFAATLECQVQKNLDVIKHSILVTSMKDKILIAGDFQLISFVTETTPDVFSIEVFVPELDARIYSEGSLKEPGKILVASVWARDVLADVSCKKLK